MLLAALLLFPACSGFGGKLRIEFENHPELNQDFPLRVDFVIGYDRASFEELKALDAASWFEKRDQFLRDLGTNLGVFSWELVPRQTIPTQPVRFKAGASGGAVFALYSSPGDHRVEIEPLADFVLQLGETDFTVQQPRARRDARGRP